MVGPSKILTVSYGTFSCTLEGFDDPFSTMKVIAEYFRDLAADDRFFGAEPPTPDAQMLHQLAELGARRRVDAKVSPNGVVLRQSEVEATPAAPEVEAEPTAKAAPETEAEEEVEPEAVAEAEPEVVAEVIEAEEEGEAEEVSLTLDSAIAAADGLAAEAASLADDLDMEEVEAAAEAGETEVAKAEGPATVAIEAQAAPTADPDSVAAKLMRIRAVVDEVRSGMPPATAEMLVDEEDAEADIDSAVAAGTLGEFGFELDQSQDDPELLAAEAERAKAEEFEAEAEAEQPATDETDDSFFMAEDEPEAAADDGAFLRQLEELRRETNEAIADNSAVEKVESTVEAKAPARVIDKRFDMSDLDDDEEEEVAEAPQPRPGLFERARSRVIKLGRGSRILAPSDHDTVQTSHEPEELIGSAEGYEGEVAENAAADEDPDVSRLMEEAKQKLDNAESRRRFSAISHLKAAVAATLADRKMMSDDNSESEPTKKEDEISQYREDLSIAVRPRRQTPEQASNTPRPVIETRAAPLVLVSEQRIDDADVATRDAHAVRPRRVTSKGTFQLSENDDEAHLDDGAEADDEAEIALNPEDVANFSEFAERLGASTLIELLEAAAAYTASVEGQPHFSRPEILRKVEFVSSRGEYNREDGLRSFGTLLREGKIQRVSKGQFSITDHSKFMSRGRRAG